MKKHMSHNEGTRNGRRKKKVVVANKKNFRRTIGIIVVVVMLIAVVQTGVLAAGGLDTSGNEVAVQSVDDLNQNVPEQPQQDPAEPPANGGETDSPAEPPANGGETDAPAEPPANGGETDAPAEPPANGGETDAPAEPPANGGGTDAPAEPPVENGGEEGDTPVAKPVVKLWVNGAQYGEDIIVENGYIDMPGVPDETGGKVFEGWFTDEGCTVAFDPYAEIKADMVLYAKLADADIIVKFLDQDGKTIHTATPNESGTVEEYDGISQIVPPAGKVFNHWAKQGLTDPFDFSQIITENTTLVPVFGDGYIVRFDTIFGDTKIKPAFVQKGGLVSEPDVKPTEESGKLKFLGWSKEPNGQGRVLYDFKEPVNQSFTLYAVWEGTPVKYTVRYWLEKPNVAGTPSKPTGYDQVNLEMDGRFKPEGQAIPGEVVSAIPSELYLPDNFFNVWGDNTSNNRIIFETQPEVEPLTITTNEDANVLNVYYNRKQFTFNFLFSGEFDFTERATSFDFKGVNGISDGTYQNVKSRPVYSFTAKIGQVISDLWPSVSEGGYINANGAAKAIAWSDQTNNSRTISLANSPARFEISYLNSGNTLQGKSNIDYYLFCAKNPIKSVMKIWYETLPTQNNGQPPLEGITKVTNVPLKASYVVNYEKIIESVNPTENSVLADVIDGMTYAGMKAEKQGDGSYIYNLYYNRYVGALDFDADGGAPVPQRRTNQLNGTPMSYYKPAQEPVKEGFDFAGWYYDKGTFKKAVNWDSDVLKTYSKQQLVCKEADVMIYAKWIKHGETDIHTVNFYDSSKLANNWSSQQVKNGENAADDIKATVGGNTVKIVPGASVDGYGSFAGWFYLLDGKEVPFSFSDPINFDTDVYAKWKTDGFEITYDIGEGTGTAPLDGNKYNKGVLATVKSQSGFTPPSGKTFIGWKSNVDGNLYQANRSVAVNSDIIFTAAYAGPGDVYSVTYKSGFDTSQFSSNIKPNPSIPETYKINLSVNPFTQYGFEFTGWLCDVDSNVYEAGTVYSLSKNTVFTAQWKRISYDVTFHRGAGGTIGDDNNEDKRTVDIDTDWSSVAPPKATADNEHYFDGWQNAEGVKMPSSGKIDQNWDLYPIFKAKKQIELNPKSMEKVYDGTPLVSTDIDQASKDRLNAYYPGDYAEIETSGTQTDVGVLKIGVTSYKIFRDINGVKTDVSHEYQSGIFRANATLTVTPKPITVTPNEATKVYGDPDPDSVGYTVVDSQNNDITNSMPKGDKLDVTIARGEKDGAKDVGEDVGNHVITIVSGANPNYTITSGNGTLNITPREVVITANGALFSYTGSVPVFTPAIGSVEYPKGAPTIQGITAPEASATWTPTAERGEHPVTVVLPADSAANKNYTITTINGKVIIKQSDAEIIINVADQKITYGDTEQAPAVTVMVGGKTLTPEEYAAQGISFDVVREDAANKSAGTYKYSVENLVKDNFMGKVEITAGSLTIARKPITIAAIANGKVYRGEEPKLEAKLQPADGAVGTDTLIYSVIRDTSEQYQMVGTHKDNIKVDYVDEGVNKNYLINAVPADFSISKNMEQIIVLQPDDASKIYGDVDPTFTMNNVQLPDDIQLEAGTDYTLSRNIVSDNGQFDDKGNYAITVKLTDSGIAKLANYESKPVDGVFTINQREAKVTLNSGTKVYGDADPSNLLTENTVENVFPDDLKELNYKVTRDEGENVKDGGYAVTGVDNGSGNYFITFVPGTLTITKRTITVTPNDDDKIYGDADPDFKGDVVVEGTIPGTLPGGGTPDAPQFDVERGEGENVGKYPIIVKPGADNPNYDIVQGGGTGEDAPQLEIKQKEITVTAPKRSITVGDAVPDLEELKNFVLYNPGLVGNDVLNFSLSYDGNVDNTKIGDTAILVNKGENPNYDVTTQNGNLRIDPITVTGQIVVNDGFKTYDGGAEPEVFTSEDNVKEQGVVYELVREQADNQNVGSYKINVVFPEGANPNFDTSKISIQTGNYVINQKPIDVWVDPATKVYSAADPKPYTVVSDGLVDKDKTLLKANVIREDEGKYAEGGENVGDHPLTLTIVDDAISKNYKINNLGGNLKITPKPIIVSAENETMVYGTTPEPALRPKVEGLVKGDELKINLARDPGKDVGTYNINVTVDPASKSYGNYTITTQPARFEITPKPITVRVNDATKIYGNADPAFYGTPDGMLPGDVVNLRFTRAPGEDVGTYAINAETVDAKSNYTVTSVTPGRLTITQRPIAISPIGNGKVYGDSDPVIASSISGGTGPIAPSYSITRQPGENVGNYVVSVNLIGSNSNYTISTGSANFVISPRPITLAADDKVKTYGDADPELTSAIKEGNLIGTDTLDYTISREAGEDVGSYAIEVAAGTNPNYAVTTANGVLTIAPRDVDVVITPNNATKVYGSNDPALTATVTGTVNNDQLNYTLVRQPGENAGGYTISVELGANPNYRIYAGEGEFTVTPKAASINADSYSKTAGQADPQLTAVAKGVIGGDKLEYTISREAGEDVGVYAINVAPGSNPNYNVTTAAGALTISALPVPPVTPGTTEDPPVTPVTPAPADPAAPPTPAPTEPVQAATPQQTVNLAGNTTPLADAAPNGTVDLNNGPVPLASNWSSWALLNLIFTILTAILAAIMLITYFVGKKKEQDEAGSAEVRMSEYEAEEEETTLKRKGFIRLLSVLVAVAAIIIFLVTEDITRPMVLTDRWTAFMGVIAIVQVVVMFFSRKTRDNDSDSEQMQKEDVKLHNV